MSTITERVRRGAALLDEKRPGWWRDIDLGRLDIDSCSTCILGQIGGGKYGAYTSAMSELGLGDYEDVEYGFDGDYPGALTEAWRDLIGQRLAQAVPA